MGRHWGQIAYSRGMIRYALSQHEQNAMYGFFKKGGPNLAKRVYSQIFKIAPMFVGAYMLIRWGEAENKRAYRKDPAEFANDS